jgi:hypothetical protein
MLLGWSRSLAMFGVLILLGATPSVWVEAEDEPAKDPHQAFLGSPDDYPSAKQCAACHKRIYDEWSISSHANAGLSPVFHKFEQKINDLAPTIGTFCVRCHMGAGTALGEAREMPLWKRSQVSREGVTCISCHRINQKFGRVNGERSIVPGNIFQPIYGPIGGAGIAEVVKDKDYNKVATTTGERGTKMHASGVKLDQLAKSEFCASCHQVAVNIGIKLEVVWEQYRASPAFKKGITCQDCHMGKVPGKPEGFETIPVALVNGKVVTPERTHFDHRMIGPGYSIAHPGLYPHHPDADNWSMEDWLQFNFRARWGSEEFEAKLERGEVQVKFPSAWSDRSDRESAWEIVSQNQKKLAQKKKLRSEMMENGSKIEGPFIEGAPLIGKPLRFAYRVTNLNEGHNLPSGSLGAQPEIWLNVALIDPSGKNVWESGYVDNNGDMADLHSLDVAAERVERDLQLFNLQTKFLTSNVKGTDREMYLPVNFDLDQLPFLRPPGQPVSVLNHPPFVRMEGRSIPPLGSRMANYEVPASAISRPGSYKLAVRLRSRAEPIYFMRFIGATTEMERVMNRETIDIHPYTVKFEVTKQ